MLGSLDEFDTVRGGSSGGDGRSGGAGIEAVDAWSVVVSIDERLARWAQRDAVIGLDAELVEARVALGTRDAEIGDLRERNERLAQRVAQLVTERDGLARQVSSLQRPPVTERMYRKFRSLAGLVLVRSVRP